MISDRFVLTEKVISNCYDYSQKLTLGKKPWNDKIMFQCSDVMVLLTNSTHVMKETVWAILTMKNGEYSKIKDTHGMFLEEAGIEMMHYDGEKVDVVFAIIELAKETDMEKFEGKLTAWCKEACRSGVEAFKKISMLPVEFRENSSGRRLPTEKSSMYVKAILGERDLRLKNLCLSLGLSKTMKWKGCPKSWHSTRHEIKKVKHKLSYAQSH